MFLKKIKNWLSGNDGITVDDARENYKECEKKHDSALRLMQLVYIPELCDEIKTSSKKGKKSITTVDTLYDFFTYDFMDEVKEFFEKRGFTVKEEKTCSGVCKSWLRISWE